MQSSGDEEDDVVNHVGVSVSQSSEKSAILNREGVRIAENSRHVIKELFQLSTRVATNVVELVYESRGSFLCDR